MKKQDNAFLVTRVKIADMLNKRLLRLDLQTRLIVGFLIAACLTGLVATLVGIWTINRITIAEIQNRVRQDINTVNLIYNYHLEKVGSLLKLSVERSDLVEVIQNNQLKKLNTLKDLIRNTPVTKANGEYPFLDTLTVVDAEGNVLYRVTNQKARGDSMLWDPVVKKCIETRTPQVSTELISLENIILENPLLRERVSIDIIKTPMSIEMKEKRLSDGMIMRAAYPILDDNRKLFGVLVGGYLLTQDRSIVDKVKETIYQDEKYQGHEMGVATIFQGGVRISTNVMTTENVRAVGTVLSKEVYKQVIEQGKDWVGRAFVVNDWYITTYRPIYDSQKKLIGILYTGLLEKKYRDIRWKLIGINLAITTLGMILAFIISLNWETQLSQESAY